jgi:hypothetical protein
MPATASRSEATIDSGLSYAPGDPVLIHVHRRERRVAVTDAGAAVERGGRPPGWREAADRIADELVVNVSRHGVVSLPVVRVGPPEEVIVRRIAAASLALYQDLLELSA